MPGMTGKEVLQHIKRDRPELPVIICSGYLVDPDDLEREIGAPIHEVLT